MGATLARTMTSGSNFSMPQKLLCALVFFLLLSAVYLYPFPQANVFYPAVVLMHAFVGVIAAILLVVLLRTGTPHSEFRWLYAHIIASIAGAACLLAEWLGKRGWLSSNAFVRVVVCLMVVAGIGWAARYQRET